MIEKKKKYKLGDFDYPLPKKYIAQYPGDKRDQAKLMVVNRETKSIEHKKFSNIVDYLRKNDLLILNNTKVFPARLFATKDRTDAKVEVFLLRELAQNLWEVMVRPARKVRIGNKLIFGDGIICDVIDNTVSGGRVIRFDYDVPSIYPFIDANGASPLPPYIDRKPVPSDKENYQTVYATERGSVAAPTAGIHFTKELLTKLKRKGVKQTFITLHIGLGTFKPILVEDLTRHHMDSESFSVPRDTAELINTSREKNRRVITVGTSTVRTLETVVVSGFQITPRSGWTDKFIYPPYEFKMSDMLITNFHQPQSTLMMLVSAYANKDFIMHAYKEAIKKKYRFYSYGDAMLIM